MRALTASEMISLWERGTGSAPAAWSMLLLAAVNGEAPPGPFEQFPVGWRDAKLLELRERTFGPQLPCLTTCPSCREDLEYNLNVADLVVGEPPAGTSLEVSGSVRAGDYEVTFRLPTAGDLLALFPQANVSENRLRLLKTCLLSARCNDREIAACDLPGQVAAAVAERMAQLDPQADLRLRLDCPECGHRWEAQFDIVSFLWKEIHAAATRLLREVHELATAHGWSEAAILALSPQRRRAYLELARS